MCISVPNHNLVKFFLKVQSTIKSYLIEITLVYIKLNFVVWHLHRELWQCKLVWFISSNIKMLGWCTELIESLFLTLFLSLWLVKDWKKKFRHLFLFTKYSPAVTLLLVTLFSQLLCFELGPKNLKLSYFLLFPPSYAAFFFFPQLPYL